MVDKVRALKYESSSIGGTENDALPTDTNPSEDYLSAKGVALEDNDSLLIHSIAGDITFQDTVNGTVAVSSLYKSGGTDVAITDGGTGASNATTAFNNLGPTTTKGDIIVHNGTTNVRLPVGADNQVLKANSVQASGIEWVNQNVGITRYISAQFRNNNNYNGYAVTQIGSNNEDIISFTIPSDANQITKVAVYGFVAPGAAQTARNIDFTAVFAGIGEVFNANTASNTTSTYDLSTFADKLYEFNITSMFSALSGGDVVGLTIKHNTIGGTIHYLAVVVTLTT